MINCAAWMALVLFLGACKKNNYLTDTGVSKPNVNMTTYDYLASNPNFTQLAHLIDRAGLKDMVNGNITFFAVTNYGVNDWVAVRRAIKVQQTNNENIVYTIDSIPVSTFKDSLLTYMFDGKITRDNLTVSGNVYDSKLGPYSNITYLIKLRRVTNQYTAYLDHVDYINFTKVIAQRDDLVSDINTVPTAQRDKSFDCQTTGLITTTGVVHVLDGLHKLFFN